MNRLKADSLFLHFLRFHRVGEHIYKYIYFELENDKNRAHSLCISTFDILCALTVAFLSRHTHSGRVFLYEFRIIKI
jgi:hypothetical protein